MNEEELSVHGASGRETGSAAGNRGFRLDLLIAVCALLISSLASAASWWQARLLGDQTRVLQEQLGAQVWPYLDVPEEIDNATVSISLTNNGLGPAVIRSAVVRVDGRPERSMVAVVHRLLGPHLIARKPRNEHMRLALDSQTPGSVLRAGESLSLLKLTSKTFVPPFVSALPRVTIAVCYCAIVPGQCWSVDSALKADPLSVPACAERRDDLLHASPLSIVNQDY